MPQPILGPAGATTVTPPSQDLYSKIIKLDTSAGDATGFLACILPKGAFVSGVFVRAMGANASQTVSVGITNGGAEFLSAYAPNSTGFSVPGASVGSYVGTQLAADTPVYAKASAALTSVTYVIIQYYIPQQGMSW